MLREREVHYIDLDLQYSTYAVNSDRLHSSEPKKRLTVLRSVEGEVAKLFIKLLGLNAAEKGGLVILDSVNMLQTMLQKRDSTLDYLSANHKAAILITLSEQFAARYSKVLVLANVNRSRPREVKGSQVWESELTGGRMLRLKSDALISVHAAAPNSQNGVLKVTVDALAKRYVGPLKEGSGFDLRLESFR